jgi:hypothetical protein
MGPSYVVFTLLSPDTRLAQIAKSSMRSSFSETASQPPVCTSESAWHTLSQFLGTERDMRAVQHLVIAAP